MSEPEPPAPPSSSPPPRSAPRPDVPLTASCLTILVGIAIALCVGGAAVAVVASKSAAPRIARGRQRRAALAETEDRAATAKSLLDAIAARISAGARAAGELPEMLDETLPRDPWGRVLEYERTSADHATLASAGPDGKLRTRDDIRREIVLK